MIKGWADVQTPTFHPEVRMAEMVSMGVGNKAFRDIAPSEEAINDRTVNYILKCQGSRQAAGVGWGELLRERCGPLAALACTPLRTSAQMGSGLTQPDSLMQQFALGRGTTRISGSLSCGAREVRSPCAWRGGARPGSRVTGGD